MFFRSFGVFPLFIKRRCILLRCQAFSTSSSDTNFNKHVHSSKKELLWKEEVAARLDFHLVQLFFACLPSLAVYLVAQYARSEIRRMEAEVEQKKKQAEEENKVKDAELEPTKGKSNNDLSEVKIRLSALEAALKEMVDEKINVIHNDPSSNKKVRNGAIEPSDKNSKNQNEAKDFDDSSTTITQNADVQNKNADIAAA